MRVPAKHALQLVRWSPGPPSHTCKCSLHRASSLLSDSCPHPDSHHCCDFPETWQGLGPAPVLQSLYVPSLTCPCLACPTGDVNHPTSATSIPFASNGGSLGFLCCRHWHRARVHDARRPYWMAPQLHVHFHVSSPYPYPPFTVHFAHPHTGTYVQCKASLRTDRGRWPF
jgi:hypothetical protein